MTLKFNRILWLLPNNGENLIYVSLIKGIEMMGAAFERINSEFGSLDYLSKSFNFLYEKLYYNNKKGQKYPIFRSFDFIVLEVKSNFLIFIKLIRLRRFTLAFGVVPYFFSLKWSCFVGLWRGLVEMLSKVLLK